MSIPITPSTPQPAAFTLTAYTMTHATTYRQEGGDHGSGE